MRALAMGLQLRETYFDSMFADPAAWVAMWHYPPHPSESDLWGVGPHTDHEVLTVILQDEVGGLQVETNDGAWMDVPPIPGSFQIVSAVHRNSFPESLGSSVSAWSPGNQSLTKEVLSI